MLPAQGRGATEHLPSHSAEAEGEGTASSASSAVAAAALVSTTCGDGDVCSVIGGREEGAPTPGDTALHVPNPKMPNFGPCYGRKCPLSEEKPQDVICGKIHGFCRQN